MKHPDTSPLKAVALAAAILSLITVVPVNAQGTGDTNTAPPAASPPSAPGTSSGDAITPGSPATGNIQSDDDYESMGEPFGRGCPYSDDNLELVS